MSTPPFLTPIYSYHPHRRCRCHMRRTMVYLWLFVAGLANGDDCPALSVVVAPSTFFRNSATTVSVSGCAVGPGDTLAVVPRSRRAEFHVLDSSSHFTTTLAAIGEYQLFAALGNVSLSVVDRPRRRRAAALWPPAAPPASSPSDGATEDSDLVTVAFLCFGIGVLSACGISAAVALCRRRQRRAVEPRVVVRFAGPPGRESAFALGARLAAAHGADVNGDGSITMEEWKTGQRPWAPQKPPQRRLVPLPPPPTVRPTALPPAPAPKPSSAEILLKELRLQELRLQQQLRGETETAPRPDWHDESWMPAATGSHAAKYAAEVAGGASADEDLVAVSDLLAALETVVDGLCRHG